MDATKDKATPPAEPGDDLTLVAPTGRGKAKGDWVVKLIWGLTVALMTAVFAILIWQLVCCGQDPFVRGWAIGGFFMCATVPLAIWDILGHARHYAIPRLQRPMMRILIMPLIFSIESWFGLRFQGQAIYLQTLRNAYECLTLYSFYQLLYEAAGPPKRLREVVLRELGPHQSLFFPLCCVRMRSPQPFLWRMSWWALQFIPIQLTVTIIYLIGFHFPDVFQRGFLTTWNTPQTWFAVVVSVSECVTIWALLTVTWNWRKPLKAIDPVIKFLIVKLVVLVTFYQSIIFAALVRFGAIPAVDNNFYGPSEVSTGIQNFLICIEMFVMSVLSHFAFSWSRNILRKHMGRFHLMEQKKLRKNGLLPALPSTTAGEETVGISDSKDGKDGKSLTIAFMPATLALWELIWPLDILQDLAVLWRRLGRTKACGWCRPCCCGCEVQPMAADEEDENGNEGEDPDKEGDIGVSAPALKGFPGTTINFSNDKDDAVGYELTNNIPSTPAATPAATITATTTTNVTSASGGVLTAAATGTDSLAGPQSHSTGTAMPGLDTTAAIAIAATAAVHDGEASIASIVVVSETNKP